MRNGERAGACPQEAVTQSLLLSVFSNARSVAPPLPQFSLFPLFPKLAVYDISQ